MIELKVVESSDLVKYKSDMQEAFQKGFERYYGKSKYTILPEADIDESLNTKGAKAYKAVLDGEMVGGAIVVIDPITNKNSLHLLYVKYNLESKGIGKEIWDFIEGLYPNTKSWETCTPYFDKRNVYFYLNKCGFHIVRYVREINKEGFVGDGGDGMFEFIKTY